MNKEEFLVEMQSIAEINDVEDRHRIADELMCEVLTGIGYDDGVKCFKKS